MSRYLTVGDLKEASMRIFENSYKSVGAEEARMWKLDSTTDIKQYHELIKETSKLQTPNRYFLENPKGTTPATQPPSLTTKRPSFSSSRWSLRTS